MRTHWVALLAVGIAGLTILVGCGGHDGQVPPVNPPGAAAFVGRTVCVACHGAIAAAYADSAHGLDFATAGGVNRITGSGGACAPCHTTGFGEPTGFVSVARNPHLGGISCEECHGGGSLHAGVPSVANITLTPQSAETCFDCHSATYKLLRSVPPRVTNATLRNTAPGSVSMYFSQATFQQGYLGFNRDQILSTHSFIPNTCVNCHLNAASADKHGETSLEVDHVACEPCHGSEAVSEALHEAFEAEINALMIELGGADPSNPGLPDEDASGGLLAAFAAAKGIDLDSNSDPDDPDVQAYKAARYNYEYALAGHDDHNPPFARTILADAKFFLR